MLKQTASIHFPGLRGTAKTASQSQLERFRTWVLFIFWLKMKLTQFKHSARQVTASFWHQNVRTKLYHTEPVWNKLNPELHKPSVLSRAQEDIFLHQSTTQSTSTFQWRIAGQIPPDTAPISVWHKQLADWDTHMKYVLEISWCRCRR